MDIILNEQIAFKNPDWNVDFHIWDQLKTIKHIHTFREIFIVTKGIVLHTVNGVEEQLSVGDIRFINPNDCHFQRSADGSAVTTINVSFNDGFLSTCNFLNEDLIGLLSAKNFNPVQHLSTSELNFMIFSANNITKSQNSEDELRAVKTLIVLLINHFISSTDDLLNTENPKWFNDFVNLLNDPNNFSLSITELCSKVNYSPSALSAVFKKYTGKTIINYFTNVKLNYACNLLRNTNYPVSTVSSLLGFDSISHFDHIFKSNIGITPKQYKKENTALAAESPSNL